VSGRGAATNVRGRLKAKEQEAREKKENNEITDAVKTRYAQWNKGVKQAANIQERIQEDLREMDKPLTRTANDVDREAHLKDIERAEDPMIAFFRKKRAKKAGGKSKYFRFSVYKLLPGFLTWLG
jgi:hypothetical protein